VQKSFIAKAGAALSLAALTVIFASTATHAQVNANTHYDDLHVIAPSETVRDPQVDLCSGRFAIQSEVGAGIELQVVRAGRLPGTGHIQRLLQSRAGRLEIRVLPVFGTRGDLRGNGAGDAKRRDARRMPAPADLVLENVNFRNEGQRP